MKLWPTFETPCPVEFLQLFQINMDSDTFANSALHKELPKIKVIEINECKGPNERTIELPGIQFNRNMKCLRFGLKNGLRIHFYLATYRAGLVV